MEDSLFIPPDPLSPRDPDWLHALEQGGPVDHPVCEVLHRAELHRERHVRLRLQRAHYDQRGGTGLERCAE